MMTAEARARCIAALVVAGTVVLVGCGPRPEARPANAAGVAERAGAAVDRTAEKAAGAASTAAERTGEAARDVAAATKVAAGKAVEKTGEALQKAGTAVEGTGTNMQK